MLGYKRKEGMGGFFKRTRWLRKAWRCSGSGALNQAGGQIKVRSRGAAGLGKKCSEETQLVAGTQARWPETEEKLAIRQDAGRKRQWVLAEKDRFCAIDAGVHAGYI